MGQKRFVGIGNGSTCQTVDGKQATAYVTHEGEKTTIPPSDQGNLRDSPVPYNLFEDKPIELGAGRQIGGVKGNDTFLDGLLVCCCI